MKSGLVITIVAVIMSVISLSLVAQEIEIILPAGPLGAGFIIGSVLREMDLSGIDYAAITVAAENDKAILSLTEPLPSRITVTALQTDLQRHALEQYKEMEETFEEWMENQDTVVRMDEAGHPLNEAGQAIIDDKGNTAAPTGKVSKITFSDFEKELQVVKSCQESLKLASNGRQKKQDAHTLAKAVTLLQNMNNAYRLAEKAKSLHMMKTLAEWGNAPDMEMALATISGGERVPVFERSGHYYLINEDGTLGDEVPAATVKAYKLSDAMTIKKQLDAWKQQYTTTKSSELEKQITVSTALLERLDKAFWLTKKAKAEIARQAQRAFYLRLIVIGLGVLVVVGVLLLR